jgi:cation-transporting ATPase E
MSVQPLPGLTAPWLEDELRRARPNRSSRSSLLSHAEIVARNLFTLFNAVIVPAAVALVALGDTHGAAAVSGMAAVNTAIGLTQELVTKRRLERLVILAERRERPPRRPRARGLRKRGWAEQHMSTLRAAAVAKEPVQQA